MSDIEVYRELYKETILLEQAIAWGGFPRERDNGGL